MGSMLQRKNLEISNLYAHFVGAMKKDCDFLYTPPVTGTCTLRGCGHSFSVHVDWQLSASFCLSCLSLSAGFFCWLTVIPATVPVHAPHDFYSNRWFPDILNGAQFRGVSFTTTELYPPDSLIGGYSDLHSFLCCMLTRMVTVNEKMNTFLKLPILCVCVCVCVCVHACAQVWVYLCAAACQSVC